MTSLRPTSKTKLQLSFSSWKIVKRIIRVYQIQFEIYGDPCNRAISCNTFYTKVNVLSAHENLVTEAK